MVATVALIALHVRSIALSSSTLRPQLDVPFTVTVSIAVKEKVADLPNVYLPSFFGPEELGDERSYVRSREGTLYRETMTLEAHSGGALQISPAYMDAVDARDGKPKRFLSNALTLYVQGGALADPWAPLRFIGALMLYAILAIAAAFVVFAVFLRRRTPAQSPETTPKPETPVDVPALDAEDQVAQAVGRLRARRDRASVLAVRALLWEAAGANAGETLEDVLQKLPGDAGEARRRATLIEHAAFADDSRMQAAIAQFLSEYDGSVFA